MSQNFVQITSSYYILKEWLFFEPLLHIWLILIYQNEILNAFIYRIKQFWLVENEFQLKIIEASWKSMKILENWIRKYNGVAGWKLEWKSWNGIFWAIENHEKIVDWWCLRPIQMEIIFFRMFRNILSYLTALIKNIHFQNVYLQILNELREYNYKKPKLRIFFYLNIHIFQTVQYWLYINIQ